MINKLLIANRGEIALRIGRACAEMGICSLEEGVRSVAIYTDAGHHRLHVKKADEAMKMETDVHAPLSGKVTAVNVAKGDSVNPDEALIEIEG